ncbi:MAG: DUF6353 family protein [Ruminococcus sp.]|nr:DUF6353 family protein [Ruminococcus sp.]
MNKSKIYLIMSGIKNFAVQHCPEILTGMGVAGMLTAGILAVKTTPKALALIEEKKREKNTEKLTAAEMIKSAGLCYVPSAVTAVVSAACIVGASAVNYKRNAALAAVYALSETSLKEYREKAEQLIGKKKAEDISDAVAKDRIEQAPVGSREVVFTGSGETLCYDVISGRYFTSEIEKIKRAVNDLNRQMRDEMFISLNDFYIEIGLKPIPIGSDIGWHIDKGYIDIRFSSQITDDERPCVVINYSTIPRYGYSSGFALGCG